MRHHRIPPHAIDRPALRRQLDAGVGSPLSLVVAPAGTGKSVLLAQWSDARPDLAVAWFDITSADRGVVEFAQRIIDGISAVAEHFDPPSTPVDTTEGRLGEPFLEHLAANLAGAGNVVLVFDDLDRLSGSGILADLWRLVDLLPPTAHAIFASRIDLHLGWSRHRLQHGLVEIRQRELAFDPGTTGKVIEAITGHPVSAETAAAVTTATEGWAVGVQFTALGLRFATDPDRIVDGITGTDQRVVDYLSEEVLDALTPERSEALKRLAVLDEVCAGLAEAVAGVEGDEFLGRLERDSLFIVGVPGRPGWYRFHRLFRDLLSYRLRAEDRDAEQRVFDAAAEWCLGAGDVETAVEYLLRARRWDRVLGIVQRSERDTYREVRTSRVMQWLSRVPAEVRADRPDAELLLAMAEGFNGRSSLAVDRFQAALGGERLSPGQQQIALTYLAAEVQFRPRPEAFLAVAERALALLAEHPDAELPDLMGLTSRPLLRMVGHVARARAQLFLGRLVEAHSELLAVLEAHPLEYAPYRVHAEGSLALVEALSGRLVAAEAHAREALETAREISLHAHPAPADAHLALAFVAIQRGEPGAGANALDEGSISAAANHRTQLMWLAQLASRLADPDGLQADSPPADPPPPVVAEWLTAIERRESRLRGVPVPPSADPTTWSPAVFESIAALLELGMPAAARTRLDAFCGDGEPLTPASIIERELLDACLSAAEGRRAQARGRLEEVLSRAEPEWLVAPFVSLGPRLLDLLDETTAAHTAFGRFVSARIRREALPREEGVVEQLTPRELELLAYLPSRYTIADIAERCFVSSNTVKTHLAHIYRKLGVAGRDAAIERATTLGLLDPRDARVG